MQKQVSRVLWITLFLNLLVSGIKISIGLVTRIQSILADGYHSLSDSSSNIIGLISTRISNKPVDDDHAYGHQRYETLATLVIVALLVFLGIEVISKAIGNLVNPAEPSFSLVAIILMSFTLAVNMFVTFSETHYGKKYKSTILIADAKHTASDIYITLGVLTNLVAITVFNAPLWLDSITSLVIAVVIFRTAYGIFLASSKELTDAIAVDPYEIEEVVMKNIYVDEVHKIRSRKSGNHVFIDFHVKTDPEMLLVQAHQLSHDLEDSLKQAFEEYEVSAVVHVEPKGVSSMRKK